MATQDIKFAWKLARGKIFPYKKLQVVIVVLKRANYDWMLANFPNHK